MSKETIKQNSVLIIFRGGKWSVKAQQWVTYLQLQIVLRLHLKVGPVKEEEQRSGQTERGGKNRLT